MLVHVDAVLTLVSCSEQVVAVPVPEKVQPQHNFVVIPSDPTQDSLVWSVNTNWSSKNISFRASASSVDGGDTWIDAVGRVLNQELRPYGRKLVQVDPNEFESSIVQAHRKSEKGYHVKAWRGSKDGKLVSRFSTYPQEDLLLIHGLISLQVTYIFYLRGSSLGSVNQSSSFPSPTLYQYHTPRFSSAHST